MTALQGPQLKPGLDYLQVFQGFLYDLESLLVFSFFFFPSSQLFLLCHLEHGSWHESLAIFFA